MSVGSVGSTGGFDPSQMASQFFKKADTNNDGGIDKSELKTMLSKGPGGKSVSDAQVDKIFADADTNGDGKIDESENAAQMKKMGNQKPPSGSPPSGGAPSGGGSASGVNTTSSSSGKYYDKKDLNQDGVVTSTEEIEYDMKHPTYTQEGSSKNSDNGTSSLLNLSA